MDTTESRQSPLLPCLGPCGGARFIATRHAFVRANVLRNETGGRIARELVYRCTACENERRFGWEECGS